MKKIDLQKVLQSKTLKTYNWTLDKIHFVIFGALRL